MFFVRNRKVFPNIGIIFIFIIFSVFLFNIYFNRFASFGCFDECFNYVAGHYVLDGRILYKEIFFNHQMGMAYLSAIIQGILKPEGIYYLVLEHRMFIFFFGVLMDLLLIWRFKAAGVGFAFLFEATKFYFMGSLFLAESVLVYPLVYLFGLVWNKINGDKLSTLDYIVGAVCAWFVVFLREPVVIVALFLYLLINMDRNFRKNKVFSIGIFFFLSFLTFLFTSVPDYLYQVIFMNGQTIFVSEAQSYGNGFAAFFHIFLYPIVILFEGKWTFIREILFAVAIIFLSAITIFVIRGKKIKLVFLLLTILGLANLRVVTPGQMFYEAFHMLPWYGLFIISTFLLLQNIDVIKNIKKINLLFKWSATLLIVYTIFSPQSFFRDTSDREEDFRLSFDRYYIYGQAIKYLANANDTFYIEGGWDDLIYWQADLEPAYKYVVYGGSSKIFMPFIQEREKMFMDNPPDFYYSFHEKGMHPFGFLPEKYKTEYNELIFVSSPSGLYIKKSKIPEITKEQWDKIETLRFSQIL